MMAAPPISGLAFVGAGALGQSFAALVAASGRPVTLVATPASAERLLAAGQIRLYGEVELTVPVGPAPSGGGRVAVTADPGDLPRGVGLIFTTKGHQLPTAITAVRQHWPMADDRTSWVAGVQNGLIKDDQLAAAFGAERRVAAVTILAGAREADGRVRVTSRGATYLGELPTGLSPRVELAVAWLKEAGIPTDVSADIQSVLWSKMCNAVGVFGVSVLTRGAAVFGHPDLIRAYLSLIRETAATAEAYGVTIGNYTNFPIKSYLETSEADLIARMSAPPAAPPPPNRPPSLPSMTQDLLAGRAVEVDEIFADAVTRAEKIGVPAPRTALVRDLIRGLDPGHAR